MRMIQSVKALLFVILFFSIGIHMILSCTYQENMESLSPMVYISKQNDNYEVLDQLYNYNACKTKYTQVVWHVPDKDANVSTLVLPSESLHFYASTESRPECCGPTCGIKETRDRKSPISKTTGCLCRSNEQIEFLRQRGGNSIKTYDNTIF